MDKNEYDNLVELITREVMRVVSDLSAGQIASMMPSKKAIVIGDSKNLPITDSNDFELVGIDEYKNCGDIEKFDRVYIASLSLTMLCDIALGRDNTPESCAVLKALLCGKKVFICEKGLPHREYAGKGSRELFKQYEGYLNRIISFGAVLIRNQNDDKKNKNMNAFADNPIDKVITEAIARKLVENCEGDIIKIQKSTVLTPSAKDIFNHSDKTVEYV